MVTPVLWTITLFTCIWYSLAGKIDATRANDTNLRRHHTSICPYPIMGIIMWSHTWRMKFFHTSKRNCRQTSAQPILLLVDHDRIRYNTIVAQRSLAYLWQQARPWRANRLHRNFYYVMCLRSRSLYLGAGPPRPRPQGLVTVLYSTSYY